MTDVSFKRCYIRKLETPKESPPVSSWIVDENGQLIQFDIQVEENVLKEMSIRVGKKIDELLLNSLLDGG